MQEKPDDLMMRPHRQHGAVAATLQLETPDSDARSGYSLLVYPRSHSLQPVLLQTRMGVP